MLAGIGIGVSSALGAGGGTNTKEELLALWGLLTVAKMKDIGNLQVAGDSLITINWFKGVSSIKSIVLETWKRKIKALQEIFLDL